MGASITNISYCEEFMSLKNNIQNYLTNFDKISVAQAEKLSAQTVPDTISYNGANFIRNKVRDNELPPTQVAYDREKPRDGEYAEELSGEDRSGVSVSKSEGERSEFVDYPGTKVGNEGINLDTRGTSLNQLDSIKAARNRYNSVPQKAKRAFGNLMDKLSD